MQKKKIQLGWRGNSPRYKQAAIYLHNTSKLWTEGTNWREIQLKVTEIRFDHNKKRFTVAQSLLILRVRNRIKVLKNQFYKIVAGW